MKNIRLIFFVLATIVALGQCRSDEGIDNLRVKLENILQELDQDEKMNKFDTAKPLNTLWKTFKAEFEKKYSSLKEDQKRKEIFAKNVEKIRENNLLYKKGVKTFTMGINQFCDLSLDEFVATKTGFKKQRQQLLPLGIGSNYLSPSIQIHLPPYLDWRDAGYVTPVKDQKTCGACWAFSTVGSIEGQNYKLNHQLVSLSEQWLVDCCGIEGENGCEGGLEEYGFQCIKDLGGIACEDCYSYANQDNGTCNPNSCLSEVNVTGFVEIPAGEDMLQEAVALVGPISIAIDANHDSFQFYTGGVYIEPACSSDYGSLDHAMLLVGYGNIDGLDTWIVKNSWNTNWGDHGYIHIARNVDNMCGIATNGNYPLL